MFAALWRLLKAVFRWFVPFRTEGWIAIRPHGGYQWIPQLDEHHNGVPASAGWFMEVVGGFDSQGEAQDWCNRMNDEQQNNLASIKKRHAALASRVQVALQKSH